MNSNSLPKGWVKTTLGDVATFQRGFDLPKKDRIIGEYPLMVSNGQDGTHKEYKVKAPGIVTGRSGTLGEVFYVQENFWALNTTLWVKDFHNNNEKFIYYFLKRFPFKKYNSGSGVPTLNRNHIHPITVKIPLLLEQKAIAKLLSSFDEKIELLQEQSKTLEALAQAIFKEWFVNFNYPGAIGEMVDSELGKVPKGWDIQSIYDSANYTNGAVFKQEDFKEFGVPIIKIVELKNGITTQTKYTTKIKHNKYLIDDENILFSWSGSPETSIDIFLWSSGKAILNQHTYKVLQKNDIDKSWLFFQLKELKPFFVHLAKQKQTTGLGHVTITDLKNNYICKPPIEIILQFNLIGENILQKLFANKKQISSLFKVQDTLLPKLMSGEVRMEGFDL